MRGLKNLLEYVLIIRISQSGSWSYRLPVDSQQLTQPRGSGVTKLREMQSAGSQGVCEISSRTSAYPQ